MVIIVSDKIHIRRYKRDVAASNDSYILHCKIEATIIWDMRSLDIWV